ncbi:MAG: hypothetical protein MRZ79_05185 [Bacteroidia bacterium]|nr:hypothetical protein [Bacteroidia bacterium]
MKNTVITFVSLFFLFFMAQGTASAQCTKNIKSRTGTVYAAGPAKTTFKATGNTVTVKVNKTGGRAETRVNVYANNQLKKTYQFPNGNYSREKVLAVNGVKNKTIRVDIINQSVGNKFEYRLNCFSAAPASLGSVSGLLAGQGKKTQTFDRVCSSKKRIKITVTRQGGQAKGIITVKKNGRQIATRVFGKNEKSVPLTYSNAGNARYTVELKNVSVGNTIKYRMSAVQLD